MVPRVVFIMWLNWSLDCVFYAVMGNVKANMHWEAELPPNFDRNGYGIETFIRAK